VQVAARPPVPGSEPVALPGSEPVAAPGRAPGREPVAERALLEGMVPESEGGRQESPGASAAG
jgi:hypothetical protein